MLIQGRLNVRVVAALEPHMRRATFEYHWGKHHRAYVDNLNKQIVSTELAGQSAGVFILSVEMVEKSETTGGGCGDAAAAAVVVGASNQLSRRRRSFNKPSWLLCNIADLDERITMLKRKKNPKENSPDTFATRANSYYHERPQLLELLHYLYSGYLSLADRCCQALSMNRTPNNRLSRCLSRIPILKSNDESEVVDSNAKSSLSVQPRMIVKTKEMNFDMVIADLVMKTVECDIILNEVNVVEKRWGESSRKIELQKNLLDVLESERLILLNDIASLGYRVTTLDEENKGLASESLFLKRKAAKLARPGGFGKCFSFKVEKSGGAEGRKVSKMWDKVKKFDFLCGPHVDCATT
ncbi:superoxide dismutase [fe] chloroplastic [Phtheirospermum japonicum]|uniref:superoxide dismutase n=1 Tax=Phtheirospermum japonicum TaxID=374723 RepID=A0A830BFA9_9LAMI|nr:superoxide dismutase [fe] chloroplastic [Phtheirospermum japonicum]